MSRPITPNANFPYIPAKGDQAVASRVRGHTIWRRKAVPDRRLRWPPETGAMSPHPDSEMASGGPLCGSVPHGAEVTGSSALVGYPSPEHAKGNGR